MFLYFLTDLHYLGLDSAGRRYKSHCPDEPRNAGWSTSVDLMDPHYGGLLNTQP